MNKPPPQFSSEISRYIREFCHSLTNHSVTNFVHDITFGQGEISMLMADVEMFRFYYDNNIPIVCTDESGRTLSDGIYINHILEKQYRECSFFMNMLRNAAQNYGLNYGRNSLHYVVHEKNCQHLYSIFFDLNDNDFLHFVINNGAFIRDMIDVYNLKSKDIILEAQSVENRIILPSASDFILSHVNKSNQALSGRISVIHKNTGLPMQLSPQRSQCLLYLLQGKSAKEIATTMCLASKTVEHYLEFIRKELGCRSSKELILAYAHQVISSIG